MIKEILVSFLTTVDLKEVTYLEKMLDVFEGSKYFQPKKWCGGDGYPSLLYNRDQMIEGILENRQRYIPQIVGGRPNPFRMIFFIDSPINDCKKHLNIASLRLVYMPSKVPIYDIFQFGTSLAEVFKPEIASIEYLNAGLSKSGWTPCVYGNDIQEFGVSGLGIRTWIGSHITSQIGLDRLKFCGGTLRGTSWGGIELDLVESPWNADFPTILEAQQRILSNLQNSGAFGDYSQFPLPLYTPAPNWTPIPLK